MVSEEMLTAFEETSGKLLVKPRFPHTLRLALGVVP